MQPPYVPPVPPPPPPPTRTDLIAQIQQVVTTAVGLGLLPTGGLPTSPPPVDAITDGELQSLLSQATAAVTLGIGLSITQPTGQPIRYGIMVNDVTQPGRYDTVAALSAAIAAAATQQMPTQNLLIFGKVCIRWFSEVQQINGTWTAIGSQTDAVP